MLNLNNNASTVSYTIEQLNFEAEQRRKNARLEHFNQLIIIMICVFGIVTTLEVF